MMNLAHSVAAVGGGHSAGQVWSVYGIMSNFVLKMKNLNHLHIQNMNKKFIIAVTEHLSCYHSK